MFYSYLKECFVSDISETIYFFMKRSIIPSLIVVFSLLFPQFTVLAEESITEKEARQTTLVLIQDTTLLPQRRPPLGLPTKKRWVVVTAYSSTPDQTDVTPFVTASGTNVRDGVIACNFLPIGTVVKFPNLYGEKVFVVEDRMARKNRHKIDIWFSTRKEALEFGRTYTEIVIL